MKTVELSMDDYLYEFYRKIGIQAGGICPEQVMSDMLFRFAGSLSLHELGQKAAGEVPHDS